MCKMYDRVSMLCNQKGITISKMCKEIGISNSALTELKAGRTKKLSIENTILIANYFGVSVDYLLGETKNSSTDSDKGVSEYTVVAMNGTPGAHKVTVNNETMNKMAELLEEINDLEPEKIDMLIKMAKSIK